MKINYKNIQDLRQHPQSHLIPEKRKEKFDSLLLNIKQEGILQPIEISRDGTILDGHNRFLAAKKLDMKEVPVRIINPPDDFSYMLDMAIERRHLNEGQRIALTLLCENYIKKIEEEAKNKRRCIGIKLEKSNVEIIKGRLAND